MEHEKYDLETVKGEMECINISVLDLSEIKWTETRYFQSDNYKVFYSGNNEIRRNQALILRQNVARAVRDYNA